MRQIFTILFCLSVFAIANNVESVAAQVLTPPERPEVGQPVKVEFSGIVSQQKKYSFEVKSAKQNYRVFLSAGAAITLRMNKPNYDFVNRTVKVVRTVRADDEQTKTALMKEPGRQSYNLPDPLFVIGNFDHVRQMQRVMQADVKRINNYVLISDDPGAALPTEKSLQIRGQLLPGDNASNAMLKINSEDIPVILGHRGPMMMGFTILDLKPQRTEVLVWGELGRDGEVIANRIEFQPIVTKLKAPNTKD